MDAPGQQGDLRHARGVPREQRKDNAAHAPWRWDDNDDGKELPGGELARDPAKLVAPYFSGLGDFARDYMSNGYG
ncbi:MAG: hypothetical protein ACRDKW_15210 [Actinomycetota bacterium]